MNRFLSLVTVLTLSVTLAQTGPMPTPAQLAQERELTQRALGNDSGPYSAQAQLLVGQLPPQPLGPLPTLSSARLLGSVIRTSSVDHPNSQTIFLDTAASPAQVRTALQSGLKAKGWTAFKGSVGPSRSGGFQAAAQPEELAYYRLEQQVSFNAFVTRVGQTTQVTLNLLKDRNLRQQIQFRERDAAEFQSNLPSLPPPREATVRPSGQSGGGGNWTSFASIQSTLKAGALLDAYGVQLKAAGWTLLSRNTTGKTVTSVWRVTEVEKGAGRKELTGVLTLREEGAGRYSALLASLAFRD
ncbi:hypothetical protein HLB42_20215 (plasmid) [Deinococcus sp. D7000]|nr:hypothetical protein HLB42_20215 [Deinococcus sp. D7000]